MSFDELQHAWNVPGNNLPTAQQQELAQRFTRQMIRRRRFQRIWLANTFLGLTIGSVLAIRSVVTGRTNLAAEWALLPLLILPWVFAIHFWRRFLKPVRSDGGESPVIDALRTAREANRAQQTQLKRVGLLYVLIVPFLAIAMRQLEIAGKLSARELTSMAIFFGVTLLVCGAGIAARFYGRLLPQQRQLNRVLGELGD